MNTEKPIGIFGKPRKITATSHTTTNPASKHYRYRRKMRESGKCPHCGKPCAPYYECEQRRIDKKVHYHLRKLVARGILRTNGKGGYASLE